MIQQTKQTRPMYYWVSLMAVIIFIAVVTLVYIPSFNVTVRGDGHEYVLQTTSFLNHGTFGITEEDVAVTQQQFPQQADMLRWVYENNLNHLENGAAYSNHFGAYSALVSLVKTVLLVLRIYPLWAFPITNFLLYLAAVLTVFFFLKTDAIKKFCVILLLVVNPAVLYLDWIHTEVYIFAFEVIGLVFWYNRKYWLSILAVSVAAMQNLAVLPLGMAVGLDYILECMLERKQSTGKMVGSGFVNFCWKKIVPYGAFYIPALIPMISTYAKFGTYNLVAKVAMEAQYLPEKAFDYLFDLNLGIFPYEPLLLIGFFVLLATGFRKNLRSAVFNAIAVFGMLFIISNQRQINCDMHGIMRYCVWIIPVMLFYVILCREDGSKRYTKYLLAGSVLQTGFTTAILLVVLNVGAYSYVQFAPWTEIVLDMVPSLYNPSHGVFYSRALEAEKYHVAEPVVYCNEEGFVRKILLSQESEAKFYSSQYALVDPQNGNAVVDKSKLKEKTVDEGNYTYLNTTEDVVLVREYELGSDVYFASGAYNADQYNISGLSLAEAWGTWTNGNQLEFSWLLSENEAQEIQCKIDIVMAFYHSQRVNIFVNEGQVYSGEITGDEDIVFSFQRPEDNVVFFRMELPDSVSPAEVADSLDKRELALGISSLKLSDVENLFSKYDPEAGILFYEERYNADAYVQSGLSAPEAWGTWTDGDTMQLVMRVDSFESEMLKAYLDVWGTCYQPQTVTILVNGETVFSEIIEGDQDIEFTFPNPEDDLAVIDFLLPDSIQPSSVIDSTDNRDLGIGLCSLEIVES